MGNLGPMPRRTVVPEAEPEDGMIGNGEPRYLLERATVRYLRLLRREMMLETLLRLRAKRAAARSADAAVP